MFTLLKHRNLKAAKDLGMKTIRKCQLLLMTRRILIVRLSGLSAWQEKKTNCIHFILPFFFLNPFAGVRVGQSKEAILELERIVGIPLLHEEDRVKGKL
jgi:hypothetical protein